MNWDAIVVAVIAAVLLPLLKWGMNSLKEFLKAQTELIENAEFASMIQQAVDTVSNTVLYVMQTYVDSLKTKGEFDALAQQEAFNKAKERAKNLINEYAKEAIELQYGDFSMWLDTEIEKDVHDYKM